MLEYMRQGKIVSAAVILPASGYIAEFSREYGIAVA